MEELHAVYKLADSNYIIQQIGRGRLGLAVMPPIVFAEEPRLTVPDTGSLD